VTFRHSALGSITHERKFADSSLEEGGFERQAPVGRCLLREGEHGRKADSPLEESGFEPRGPLTLNIAMSPLRRIG
jgi:hypothetical protein